VTCADPVYRLEKLQKRSGGYLHVPAVRSPTSTEL
jgi:hypothetical protein